MSSLSRPRNRQSLTPMSTSSSTGTPSSGIKMHFTPHERTPSFFDRSNKKRASIQSSKKSNQNEDFIPFNLGQDIFDPASAASHGAAFMSPSGSKAGGLRNRFNIQRQQSTNSSVNLGNLQSSSKSFDEKEGSGFLVDFEEHDESKIIGDTSVREPINSLFKPPKRSLFSPSVGAMAPKEEMKSTLFMQNQLHKNERASALLGHEVIANGPNIDPLWVTVYGFNPNLTNFVIDYMRQIGQIVDIKTFQNSNFLFIKFSDEASVVASLSQNGKLLKIGEYNLFLGVQRRQDSERFINDLLENEISKSLPAGQNRLPVRAASNYVSGNSICNEIQKIIEWLFQK